MRFVSLLSALAAFAFITGSVGTCQNTAHLRPQDQQPAYLDLVARAEANLSFLAPMDRACVQLMIADILQHSSPNRAKVHLWQAFDYLQSQSDDSALGISTAQLDLVSMLGRLDSEGLYSRLPENSEFRNEVRDLC